MTIDNIESSVENDEEIMHFLNADVREISDVHRSVIYI